MNTLTFEEFRSQVESYATCYATGTFHQAGRRYSYEVKSKGGTVHFAIAYGGNGWWYVTPSKDAPTYKVRNLSGVLQ